MINFLLQGIALGATTGISCLTFCLPVFLGMSSNDNYKTTVNFILFTAGRFTAYILAGVIFSILGKELLQLRWFDGAAKFLTGILLIYWGISGLLRKKNENSCPLKKSNSLPPVLAGFLTGISPCPPFIAGLALAMSAGRILYGTLFFTGFFISTTIFLTPFIAFAALRYKEELKVIARFISIISGAIFLFYGIIKIL